MNVSNSFHLCDFNLIYYIIVLTLLYNKRLTLLMLFTDTNVFLLLNTGEVYVWCAPLIICCLLSVTKPGNK